MAGKSHGQMSLVGYSPWGHKESDTTYRVNNNNTHICIHMHTDINIYTYAHAYIFIAYKH